MSLEHFFAMAAGYAVVAAGSYRPEELCRTWPSRGQRRTFRSLCYAGVVFGIHFRYELGLAAPFGALLLAFEELVRRREKRAARRSERDIGG